MEALAEEVGHLGIKAISVEPGPFDTNFWNAVVDPDESIPEYTEIHELEEIVKRKAGRKEDDPSKAAKIFIELANNPNPPHRVFLGKIALDLVTQVTDRIRHDVEEWRDQWIATAYD
jgi:NAD(P)-dependent dehydrogenase (short-subunit alcohol dehydrogenase family)